MLLTIDAGNTRTKWAIFNPNGDITHTGAYANDQLSDIDFNPTPLGVERVIISNVAGKLHAETLEHILSAHHLPISWLNASRQSCNVINRYLEAESLGADRWAALIAAWHFQHAPCIVVNAGTAVTIDALDVHSENCQLGEFLGGMILPGISVMLTSLGKHTAQLPRIASVHAPQRSKDGDYFATSTANAIEYGTISALTGAIIQMAQALEKKCGRIPPIIISGGDASLLENSLIKTTSNAILTIDHLVLKGLYLIDRNTQHMIIK